MSKKHFIIKEDIFLRTAVSNVYPDINFWDVHKFNQMKKDGLDWEKIHEVYNKICLYNGFYSTKSKESLSHRYFNYLSPFVKQINWNQNLDSLLLYYHRQYGNKYSLIAEKMRCGDNDIKNRLKKLGIIKPRNFGTDKEDLKILRLTDGKQDNEIPLMEIKQKSPGKTAVQVRRRNRQLIPSAGKKTKSIIQAPQSQSHDINSELPTNEKSLESMLGVDYNDPFILGLLPKLVSK